MNMGFLEKNPNAPSAWQGQMPVSNRYTFGIAGERFFRAIKEEGRIFGTRCDSCNHTYVPAASFCERCMNQIDDWVDVGIEGEVVTFTHLYVNYDGSRRQEPETIAFVRLGDGGLINKVKLTDSMNISIGMRVSAKFKPLAEREGSILDIEYFETIPSKG
jgi:uncharacterized OB-fold protein